MSEDRKMLHLEARPGFPTDEVYARLVALGADKPDGDARRALAALALLLINHTGDERVIDEAFKIVESLSN